MTSTRFRWITLTTLAALTSAVWPAAAQSPAAAARPAAPASASAAHALPASPLLGPPAPRAPAVQAARQARMPDETGPAKRTLPQVSLSLTRAAPTPEQAGGDAVDDRAARCAAETDRQARARCLAGVTRQYTSPAPSPSPAEPRRAQPKPGPSAPN